MRVNRVLPETAPLASVSYGITYPYSMIGMVLLIQVLPKLLKRPIKTEEKLWLAEKAVEAPGLQARRFYVTNSNIDGKTVAELNPRRLAQVNILRIKHGEKVSAASNQTETDLPALSYASTYPVALIFKILLAQALLEILRHLL